MEKTQLFINRRSCTFTHYILTLIPVFLFALVFIQTINSDEEKLDSSVSPVVNLSFPLKPDSPPVSGLPTESHPLMHIIISDLLLFIYCRKLSVSF